MKLFIDRNQLRNSVQMLKTEGLINDGTIMIPVYKFGLNAAEIDDILSIKGLEKDEAWKIVLP